MSEYNVKCDKCSKYKPNDLVSNSYGRIKCHDCLRVKIIDVTQTIVLPSFMLKIAKIKKGDMLILENVRYGILIKKMVVQEEDFLR